MVILKINGRDVGSVGDAGDLISNDSKNMFLVVYRGVYRWVSVMVEE